MNNKSRSRSKSKSKIYELTLTRQLGDVDLALSVTGETLEELASERILAIERLIDRADGVEPEPYGDLPDLDPGTPGFTEDARRYGRRVGDEMRLLHEALISAMDRAEAASELVAELARPNRALRRSVRMRGVGAAIYDRIDEKRVVRSGSDARQRQKMAHADLERLAELNMMDRLSEDEFLEEKKLRDLLAAQDAAHPA